MPFTSGFEPELGPIVNIREEEEQLGENSFKTQTGGAPFFTNNTILFILANPTNPNLVKAYNDRISILLAGGKAQKKPHITIFEMHINQDHPAANQFQNNAFIRQIKNFYNQAFNGVTLNSPYGSYRIFGTGKKDFFVRKYSLLPPSDPLAITKFRMSIYNYIKDNFNAGKNTFQKETKNQKNFTVNYYNGQPLFAISEFHSGTGVWEPHMSIVDSDDISNLKRTNGQAYQVLYGPKYEQLANIGDKTKHLTNLIHYYGNPANNPNLKGQKIEKMVDINMIQDMSTITYFLSNGKAKINISVDL